METQRFQSPPIQDLKRTAQAESLPTEPVSGCWERQPPEFAVPAGCLLSFLRGSGWLEGWERLGLQTH